MGYKIAKRVLPKDFRQLAKMCRRAAETFEEAAEAGAEGRKKGLLVYNTSYINLFYDKFWDFVREVDDRASGNEISPSEDCGTFERGDSIIDDEEEDADRLSVVTV